MITSLHVFPFQLADHTLVITSLHVFPFQLADHTLISSPVVWALDNLLKKTINKQIA